MPVNFRVLLCLFISQISGDPWLPVIKSNMLKSGLGEREHACVWWWSHDYPWDAGGPFIGSLPHISALSYLFWGTSQCLHRRHFHFLPLGCLVIYQLPGFGYLVEGDGGCHLEAVDFEFSCLCGSVSSEKTLGLLLDLEIVPWRIPPAEAPPLSGLSFRLALVGPCWLQGWAPQKSWPLLQLLPILQSLLKCMMGRFHFLSVCLCGLMSLWFHCYYFRGVLGRNGDKD